jgi:hypothetical protein
MTLFISAAAATLIAARSLTHWLAIHLWRRLKTGGFSDAVCAWEALVLRANANAALCTAESRPLNAQFAIDFKAIPSVATAKAVLSRRT